MNISHQSFVYSPLNDETVLFQTIQLSIIDATTPGQSESGSDGNEKVFHITQSSSITEASLSGCFVSYTGNSLGESYPSAEI